MTLIDENIKIYEEVISDYVKLLSDLGMSDDPIKTFEVFCYMYMHNYLSSKHIKDKLGKRIVDMDNKFLNIDNCGCLLLGGHATCRHLADFLRRLYERLGYISSQLFVYSPHLSTDVYMRKNNITSSQIQSYVDEAIKDLDLFSDQDISFSKVIDGVKVSVRYKHDDNKPNHTVNILKKEKENRVYIVDASNHRLGDIIDEREIIMRDTEFSYRHFVYHDIYFATKYGTDYDIGTLLLNEYDTDITDDLMKSILARKLILELISDFKRFKIEHQEAYDIVNNNFKRLVKDAK